MAEPHNGDPVITHLGVSLWVRLLFVLLGAAFVGLSTVTWLVGDESVHVEIAVLLGIAFATLAFVIAGSPAVRFGPEAMEFQTLESTTVMLWTDVQSIGVEKSRLGTRTVIRTAEGSWRCSLLLNAPGWWPVMGIPKQAEVLRAAWLRSGGYADRPPIPRPWGPDLATLESVTLRPVGRQRVWSRSAAMLLLFTCIYVVHAATVANWGIVAAFVGAYGLAMAWMSRRRVVLSPAGLEIHRFRTIIVPWSAVTWISRWDPRGGPTSL